MILINKVTPLANEAFQKDLIECILKNSGNSFISNIVVFYNNNNIVLPKSNKVNLVVKNGYSDLEIIEYCKKIYNDDIFIFANPFIVFNNTLIHVDRHLSNAIKFDDCYIFDKNQFLDTSQENIEKLFISVTTNNKIILERKHTWIKETTEERVQLTPIISSKNQKNIQRYLSKKGIKDSPKIPKIDVVIVSVNYNDILPITLKRIPDIFNVTVVTDQDDLACQTICKNLNIKCIISKRIYENGDVFNKGKAINDGISSLDRPDWILLLDADIYLKDDFVEVLKFTNLNTQSLFISKRLIIDNYDMLLKWKKGEDVGIMERAKGYGFFHLFNIKKFNKKPVFPENHKDASFSDLEFRDSFKIKSELDTFVVHLGPTNQNWSGRKTDKFTNEYDCYKTNEWGVVESCKISESKYGKLNIINKINFNYHNGGWLNSLQELKNINNKNGIKFDCFLESNFCWEGNINRPYSEDWIGILHNPVEAPKWYMEKVKNYNIFEVESFKKSLKYCKGLYVFSENEKTKVKNKLINLNLKVEINVIRHTTPKSVKKWSFDEYKISKKIIHIGWWLRDISRFYKIKTSIDKIRIKLNNKIEDQISKIFNIKNIDVNEIEYLNRNQYEKIINSSIVYINLIDTSANNTILECIERCVPILVNRHPSAEEYLGVDYPLYYENDSDIENLISDDNIIKANKYLINIKRYLNMSRQIEKSLIYKKLKSEFNVETLFEPNDLENSNGGIYNPGFTVFKDKKYIISRVENLTEKERGKNEEWMKTTSVPYISEIDSDLNILKTTKLDVIGDYKRVEDFRIFSYKNKLYSNHILIDDKFKIYPVISEINIENKTLSVVGRVDIGKDIKNVEKNWIFYEMNNRLFLIYSINPMVVYEVFIENLKSKEVKNEYFKINWSMDGYLSSSTNPIKISDNRHIMGIHSRDNNLIYHQGFLIFDDNFNIINCSKNPYLSGGDFDGINKNVIYTSSITLEENLICFAGDGDIKTISIEIKNESIWKELL